MRYFFFLIILFITQSLSAQCYPDRHNTTWYDGWISCNAAPNPNAIRGESHWLYYDLGYFYKLKTSKFWNANQPEFLQDGLKDVVIDYSMDGINWQEWGLFTIGQGTGSNFYEGEEGPDFGSITARYVLVTAIDNYGGDCYSLSELKIDVEEDPVATSEYIQSDFKIHPNPVTSILYVEIADNILAATTMEISDILGKRVKTFELQSPTTTRFQIDVSDLIDGTYFIRFKGGNTSDAIRFVKN